MSQGAAVELDGPRPKRELLIETVVVSEELVSELIEPRPGPPQNHAWLGPQLRNGPAARQKHDGAQFIEKLLDPGRHRLIAAQGRLQQRPRHAYERCAER